METEIKPPREKPEPAQKTVRGVETKRRRKRLVWNAIYYDRCNDLIDVFNVFDHRSFAEDVQKDLKECETKDEFADRLRRSLQCYFWCKSEWEIVIQPWCGRKNTTDRKVDVYCQVLNNWEPFLEYVWSAKPQKSKTSR